MMLMCKWPEAALGGGEVLLGTPTTLENPLGKLSGERGGQGEGGRGMWRQGQGDISIIWRGGELSTGCFPELGYLGPLPESGMPGWWGGGYPLN